MPADAAKLKTPEVIARDNLYRDWEVTLHVMYTYDTVRHAVPGIEQKIVFPGNAYACE